MTFFTSDLTIGVACGLAISCLHYAYTSGRRLSARTEMFEDHDDDGTVYVNSLSFVSIVYLFANCSITARTGNCKARDGDDVQNPDGNSTHSLPRSHCFTYCPHSICTPIPLSVRYTTSTATHSLTHIVLLTLFTRQSLPVSVTRSRSTTSTATCSSDLSERFSDS